MTIYIYIYNTKPSFFFPPLYLFTTPMFCLHDLSCIKLWEMACAKQMGLIDYPIVCVNIDGYYDPFYSMLQRAYKDQFLYKHPDDILQFESREC